MTQTAPPAALRHELKHEINAADRVVLEGRLRAALAPDPNGDRGRYRVRSLYFDNADDKVLREKLDGAPRREKFRILYSSSRHSGPPSRSAPKSPARRARQTAGSSSSELFAQRVMIFDFFSSRSCEGSPP